MLLVTSALGAASEGACEAEAAALAIAEIDLEDAEDVVAQAELDFMLDPNPTTAAALASAQVYRDDLQVVRDQLADELSQCIAENPPPSLPIPLAFNTSDQSSDAEVEGHSVLVLK